MLTSPSQPSPTRPMSGLRHVDATVTLPCLPQGSLYTGITPDLQSDSEQAVAQSVGERPDDEPAPYTSADLWADLTADTLRLMLLFVIGAGVMVAVSSAFGAV